MDRISHPALTGKTQYCFPTLYSIPMIFQIWQYINIWSPDKISSLNLLSYWITPSQSNPIQFTPCLPHNNCETIILHAPQEGRHVYVYAPPRLLVPGVLLATHAILPISSSAWAVGGSTPNK